MRKKSSVLPRMNRGDEHGARECNRACTRGKRLPSTSVLLKHVMQPVIGSTDVAPARSAPRALPLTGRVEQPRNLLRLAQMVIEVDGILRGQYMSTHALLLQQLERLWTNSQPLQHAL
jgi:hypothetical protein